MKCYLPHIHYTVNIKQFKKAPDSIENALAYVERDDSNSCTVYIDKTKKLMPGDIAHELIHVLQFICLDRNMNFTLEEEHCAYIMHYLMGKIFGHTY